MSQTAQHKEEARPHLHLVQPILSDRDTPVWQQVRQVMEQRALSATAAALEMGISQATLSQMLSGQYSGDVQRMTATAQQWLNNQPLGDRLYRGFIQTETAQSILSTLQYAALYKDLVLVRGGAGCGKTASAAHYAETHTKNVYRLNVTYARASLGGFLRALAHALGREPKGVLDAIEGDIIAHLQGRNALLIVDEAQDLQMAALETVRRLHDLVPMGVALLGNEKVYNQTEGKAVLQDFAQLRSRIGMDTHLWGVTDKDITAFLTAWEQPTDKPTLKLARKIVGMRRSAGGLRLLKKCLTFAATQPEYPTLAAAYTSLTGLEA